MALKLITAPAAEPITRQEAKLHLRIIADLADVAAHPEDALIDGLIVAARQGAEHLTGRALMPQTWELALDAFVDEIRLPKPPLASITSIKYVDQAGVQQQIANGAWFQDNYAEPARLMPPYGDRWPSTRDQANAVLIRYVAGYADAASVPQEIKQWMLLRIGVMYENRESINVGNIVTEMPFADRLLDAYRIWSV